MSSTGQYTPTDMFKEEIKTEASDGSRRTGKDHTKRQKRGKSEVTETKTTKSEPMTRAEEQEGEEEAPGKEVKKEEEEPAGGNLNLRPATRCVAAGWPLRCSHSVIFPSDYVACTRACGSTFDDTACAVCIANSICVGGGREFNCPEVMGHQK